ncbi:MAG: radical SAM protein [Methanosarcinaceae archaeon]
MIKNSSKRCWLPWRMFRIMSDGDISMCCSNRSVIGNISRHSFEDIWNSDNAVRFRSLITEGKYIEAGCATCAFWYTFNRFLFEFPKSELSLTTIQAKNRRIQEEEYQTGRTCLDSRPSMLFIQPSYQCNLNCVMCNQKHVYLEAKGTPAVMPGLVQRLDEFEPEMEEIILQGGEPLLVPEILDYLKKASTEERNHYITLNTNGQRFHLYEDILKRIQWLKLNFSVDAGSQEIYEKIRVGGNWSQLVQNIESAVRIADQKAGGWSINIQNLVMKTNIEQVHEMVDFWAGVALNQKIYPILGADNTTENIFIYNHLLDQVPSWREALTEALDLSVKNGLDELENGLRYCSELLECKPVLTKDVHELLSESMEEEERVSFYDDVAAYKIAHVNGFTNKAYHHYVRLRYTGILK